MIRRSVATGSLRCVIASCNLFSTRVRSARRRADRPGRGRRRVDAATAQSCVRTHEPSPVKLQHAPAARSALREARPRAPAAHDFLDPRHSAPARTPAPPRCPRSHATMGHTRAAARAGLGGEARARGGQPRVDARRRRARYASSAPYHDEPAPAVHPKQWLPVLMSCPMSSLKEPMPKTSGAPPPPPPGASGCSMSCWLKSQS